MSPTVVKSASVGIGEHLTGRMTTAGDIGEHLTVEKSGRSSRGSEQQYRSIASLRGSANQQLEAPEVI